MRAWYSVATVLFLVGIGAAHAEGCGDYPYTPGINIEEVTGGVKILATASVGVSFDDVDAINDARDEATLQAKTMITQFLQEGVSSDDTINRAVDETKSMRGTSKQAVRNETVKRVRNLAGHSSGLLRGVVPLGDCYTAGREFRVTVGVKPDTIAQAGTMADKMSNSLAHPAVRPGESVPAQTGGGSQPAGAAGPLVAVPSFSNADRAKGF